MSDTPTAPVTEPTPTAPTPEPTPTTPSEAPPPEPTSPEPAPETAATDFDAEKLELADGLAREGATWDAFVEMAKAEGLSQKQAQAMLPLAEKVRQQVEDKLYSDWHKTNEEARAAVMANPKIGGDNWAKVKETISRGLDNAELSHPKAREVLDFTGAGNQEAIIETLYNLFNALSEGRSVAGSPAARSANGALSNAPRTVAEGLYGPDGPYSGGPRR